MPGFDKTGPEGRGPMTGGGFGRCAGAFDDEEMNIRGGGRWRGAGRGGRPWGGGRGRCYGGGRGWSQARGFGGFGRREPVNRDALDRTEIEEQLARLIEQNEALRSRIAELEAKNEK